MIIGNGRVTKPNKNSSHQLRSKDVPKQIGDELADRGDVLGLLDHLEDDANQLALGSSMRLISRCIRNKAKADLSGLCDDAFARILSLATLLLARVQLYITSRLTEAEAYGAHAKSGLPADLIDQGWIERAERIARFISEMATVRSRVQHVNRLNADARRSPINFNMLADSPVDENPSSPRNGQGVPGNGRFSCPETRIKFP
jgi:hypothetical protein